MTNSSKKGSGREFIITKDIGLKIENLIKEDGLINLEDIKKVLVKSNDKLVLRKRTIERYQKKKGFTHDMRLEKTLTYSKAKRWQIKVLKGIYWSWLQPNSFYLWNLFRVGKAKQRKLRKIGKSIEFHIISIKKGKGGKTSIRLFSENMTK